MGAWSLAGTVTWYRLIDDNLVHASRLLGNSGRRDGFVAHLRIGMRF